MNAYLVVPLAVWIITQLTKFAIAAFKGELDFRYLYASGGMPSVHSAVVCSLAVTAGLVSGFSSPLFGITVILAGIVMYDSFGVRRSAGEQAKAINMIIDSLQANHPPLDDPHLHLRELLGHKPKEVTAGALTGIVLAMLFNYNHLDKLWSWLSQVPSRPEFVCYLAFYGLVVIVGLVLRLLWHSRRKQSPAYRRLLRHLTTLIIAVLILGGITAVTIFERASFLSWRWLPLTVTLLTLIGIVWLVYWAVKYLPVHLSTEEAVARKAKWFEKSKKKRKKKR